MAPSDPAANPRKRKHPSFDPPRPQPNSRSTTNRVSKIATPGAEKSNVGSIFNVGGRSRKSKATSRAKPPVRAKSKGQGKTRERPGVREQEPDDDDDDDEDDDDDDDQEEDQGSSLPEDGSGSEVDRGEIEDLDSEDNADMMLAEVTHSPPSSPSSAVPAIPIPLLHRLMHHSFKRPDETKLSTDARAALGKYIEIFIREGIARCAFEVSDKANIGASGGMGRDSAVGLGAEDGWLEVEDLERVGGQLVLDF